jgi:hypothetical protein
MSYLQNVKLVAHVDLTRPDETRHGAPTTAPTPT